MKNNFEVNIVERDPRTLTFHPDNPRSHSDEAVAELAESIREDPLYFRGRPILLSNRTGELVVIGGEGRTRASILLGLEKVPTVLFDGLGLEDEVRIMQKDNDHTGKWDEAKLAALADTWGTDKIKKWSPNARWLKGGGIDIAGLFTSEKHEKEQDNKLFEIHIICGAGVDVERVKYMVADALIEFGDKITVK